jgi:pilus assembly protein Flp/PilA
MKHVRIFPVRSRRGQTLVEYALIIAMISIVAVGVLITLGTTLKGTYSTIVSGVTSAANVGTH